MNNLPVMGETVYLKGRVVGLNGEGRPIESQSVTLQLGDGQAVMTNPRNLVEIPREQPIAVIEAPTTPAKRAKKSQE